MIYRESYQWIWTISSSHLSIHSIPSHDVEPARPPAPECGAPRGRIPRCLCLSSVSPDSLSGINSDSNVTRNDSQPDYVDGRNVFGSVVYGFE